MSFLLTGLGLRTSASQIPYYSSEFVVLNFIVSYVLSSPRFAKLKYGLDHNVSPREDLTKYGDKAVSSGKVTRSQLDRIKRMEAAQANAIENFPLFITAAAMATLSGVDAGTVNGCCLVYTLARVAYTFAYVQITTEKASSARSVLWWMGNAPCLYLIWAAGKTINTARGL